MKMRWVLGEMAGISASSKVLQSFKRRKGIVYIVGKYDARDIGKVS